MATLIVIRGLDVEQEYPLSGETVVGRDAKMAQIVREAPEISRRHARIVARDGRFYLEDLKSRNKTYLHGQPLEPLIPVELQNGDEFTIGPDRFVFQSVAGPAPELPLAIRGEVTILAPTFDLIHQDAGRKLQTVLEIAQQLAGALEMSELLPKLLDHLLGLYPQADRALILLSDRGPLEVRAVRGRGPGGTAPATFSRALVGQVLRDRKGVRAEYDTQLSALPTSTVNNLGICALLCVPLITRDAPPIGVLWLDSFAAGNPFTQEDLNLLTLIGLQVSAVLTSAALHEQVVEQKAAMRVASRVQRGFLCEDFEPPGEHVVDLFATVYPARELSGDFYDFAWLDPRRLVFCIGDVVGKGLPAALFMVGVRTLYRYLVAGGDGPAVVLQRLHDAVAADSPPGMFVTMIAGTFDAETRQVTLCYAGHPPALIRRAGGRVEVLNHPPGRLLGVSLGALPLEERRFQLATGDALIFYTDGATEALAPDGKTMYELERLTRSVAALPANGSLPDWTAQLKAEIDRFTQRPQDLHDDITFLALRSPSQ